MIGYILGIYRGNMGIMENQMETNPTALTPKLSKAKGVAETQCGPQRSSQKSKAAAIRLPAG